MAEQELNHHFNVHVRQVIQSNPLRYDIVPGLDLRAAVFTIFRPAGTALRANS